MSFNSIQAGKAHVSVSLDDTQMKAGLRGLSSRFASMARTATFAGTALVSVGSLLLTPLGLSAKAASDMQETMSKFNVVFGQNSAAMKAWGDNFAGQVGRSKRQVASFLSGAQDLLVPIGFEPGEAEGFSKQITELAVDLASFNNMADADTMRDLQAALTGSGEVMKKYGVIVSESAVKQELLNQGLDPRNVTEREKVLARLNIIMRGTTAAQGDAIRTASGFANQMKRAYASVENLAVSIGNALLPVVTPLVSRLGTGVQWLARFIEKNQGVAVSAAATAVALVTLGGALIGGAGLLTGLSVMVSSLAVAIPFLLAAAPAIIAFAGGAALAAGAFFSIPGAMDAVKAGIEEGKGMLGEFADVWTLILEGKMPDAWKLFTLIIKDMWLSTIDFLAGGIDSLLEMLAEVDELTMQMNPLNAFAGPVRSPLRDLAESNRQTRKMEQDRSTRLLQEFRIEVQQGIAARKKEREAIEEAAQKVAAGGLMTSGFAASAQRGLDARREELKARDSTNRNLSDFSGPQGLALSMIQATAARAWEEAKAGLAVNERRLSQGFQSATTANVEGQIAAGTSIAQETLTAQKQATKLLDESKGLLKTISKNSVARFG